jgi:predicted Zn-dependent peptidase
MNQLQRKNPPNTRTIKSFPVPEIQEKPSEKQRLFVSNTENLGVVKMMLWFPHGKSTQKSSFIADAAYSLLLSGGNGKSEKEIIDYLDHLGASINIDCEIFGATATIRCAKECALSVLEWIVNHMIHAEYPDREFENYKLIKKASVERKMQTPQYWAGRLASENYYGSEHLLGKHGNLEEIESLKKSDILAYHSQFIHPGNSMLLVAGDCNSTLEKNLKTLHDSYFQSKFQINIDSEDINTNRNFTDNIYYDLPNSSQISLQLIKHVGYMHESELHKFTLLNMILGGYFGSRLMQEIREEKGLTYGIGSYFRPAMQGRSWIISGEMNSTNAQLALDCTLEIMEKLRTELVSEEELEKAKRYYSGQFRSGFDGPFSIAAKVQQKILRNYSDVFFADTLEHIWNITPEQIQTIAQNYLDPKSFIKVMAGKIQ